jgi:hypothetical protein
MSELLPSNAAGDLRQGVGKPWRVRDVIAALKGELAVAFVVLADVKAGRFVSESDRERAGEALSRIALFMRELEHAA